MSEQDKPACPPEVDRCPDCGAASHGRRNLEVRYYCGSCWNGNLRIHISLYCLIRQRDQLKARALKAEARLEELE